MFGAIASSAGLLLKEPMISQKIFTSNSEGAYCLGPRLQLDTMLLN